MIFPLETLFVLSIPILALGLPIVAILTSHQRKMLELRIRAAREHQLPEVDDRGIREEFQLLRETLTSHVMSVDENLKTLASRLSAIEEKLARIEATRDTLR